MKNINVITRLLSKKTRKDLHPQEAETISLLMQEGTLNTFEFRAHGITSVAQAICKLRNKGVLISVVRKPATSESGKIHLRVAHYTLEGLEE